MIIRRLELGLGFKELMGNIITLDFYWNNTARDYYCTL